MKWVPKKIKIEKQILLNIFYKQLPEDIDDISEIMRLKKEFNRKYASKEYIAFLEYSDRTGDEGQLCDKEGGYILRKDGRPIYHWENNEDGFVRDENGEMIYYKDGTPVPNIIMPAVIEQMYEEELKEKGTAV